MSCLSVWCDICQCDVSEAGLSGSGAPEKERRGEAARAQGPEEGAGREAGDGFLQQEVRDFSLCNHPQICYRFSITRGVFLCVCLEYCTTAGLLFFFFCIYLDSLLWTIYITKPPRNCQQPACAVILNNTVNRIWLLMFSI